jgi:hypothetical protein
MKISQGDLSYYALKNRDSHLVSSAKSGPARGGGVGGGGVVIFVLIIVNLSHSSLTAIIS